MASNLSMFPWGSKFTPRTPGALSKTHPNTKDIPKLFQPFKIRNLTLKNRIVVSPMCQYSSKDGMFSDWQLVELGSFATGGAGLVFTEATAVEDIGRITPYCAGIWEDKHIPPLKRITNFIHEMNAAAGIQLAHAGRKGSTDVLWTVGDKVEGWTPIAPSAIAWSNTYHVPTEMSKKDIQRVISKFVEAAKRAEEAGFDVIELHAAHGYLIHEFYSPISNQRKDEYGGSFEGRTRLCKEIAFAVRKVWPTKPLFVRLSCSDWVEGGWNIEDTIKLAQIMKSVGVDVVDCSSGGNSPAQQIKIGPSYQVPFSAAIKKQVDIVTSVVGLIYGPKQAEEILQKGEADLICMAREFLRNPSWPLRAAVELGVDVEWPYQFERAKRSKL